MLGGNELIDSTLAVAFRVDTPSTRVCAQSLASEDVRAFAKAVTRHFWYELFIDDLPIWGFVGESSEAAAGADGAADDAASAAPAVYVYTHRAFDIAYNGDTIIQVNLTSEAPTALVVGGTLEFSYSVTWHASTTPFAQRFARYLDFEFFQHQIHGFSIFNSFMMVLFLVGLVSLILVRTLRNDYARYAHADDDGEGGAAGGADALERSGGEESGWKLVHGDVFRPPPHLALLAALLGTGAQLALLTLCVTLLTIGGVLFEGRGAIATATIVVYALTSALAGYVSGGFNARHGGRAWIKAMLLTAGLFPGCVAAIAAALNTIAIAYHSLAAVPFGTIVLVTAIWAFVAGPLVLLGTVLGRNWAGAPSYPCRVKSIPRPVPQRAWYASPLAVALLGGLLPFGAIFIEVFFLFTSFWNYKIYCARRRCTRCARALPCRALTRCGRRRVRPVAHRLPHPPGGHALHVRVWHLRSAQRRKLSLAVDCVRVRRVHRRLCVRVRCLLLPVQNAHDGKRSSASGAAAVCLRAHAARVCLCRGAQGFFQTCFYFGYTAMFCAALGCLCGACGYAGAAAFVRRIYRNIKCD